ncbi:disease susceptibility protein LOV1 [Capsella rubella]|uniref:disease susceptibility protein LOV1 n=1 Tax=Capsella rubella TaxID=81985 RepID=UPI000CD50985|nr:disease susceptibility protein LOV1 [Capsella rubella]XP_023644807.1 disease susceptibility protein LOV1 [Capsella rubella]
MAEGVVLFGVQKLWELLHRESARLNGSDEEVDELKRQLGRLQALMKDADARKHDSERVRNFLEDVKDIVYDAEDVIESFLLKKFRGKEKRITRHARRLACFLVDRWEFALDIEGITKRISEVIEGMQRFGIQQIIDGGSLLSLQERHREQKEIRQTFANSSESDLVGMEQSVEALAGHLVENDNIQVVSISGMGGLGKTTLARQVLHHDMVQRHFDGFAWVCVSQQFTQKYVWQRIWKELQPHNGEISHMDEHILQGKLFKLLETGRYLVVLDDVWKEEDWDRIKAVFPRKRGWKILLTSRNEGVGVHADPACFGFRPKFLSPEESWKLCEKIVFHRRDETGTTLSEVRVDEEMESMGKEMVTYCGGLPLAVKVLGGLLAKKHTFSEWKRVYENIGTQIVGGSSLDDNNLNSINRVLSLSYEDLPMCLKHCFLYLAHFPEDHEIYVDKLFNYWASEGIITSFYNGSTIRDCGEDYLEELVRRNMVTIDKNYLFSRSIYCQMHDMMREVCVSKAKEENFLEIVKVPTGSSTISSQSPSRSRRLSVRGGNALQKLGQTNNKKVRSFLFFGVEDGICIQSATPGFRSLPLLRVLDLSSVKFDRGKLPSSIGDLIHLRFLSLHRAGVSHLPSSLRNLKLLLYLNLRVADVESVHVPNILKEMQELRYLQLPISMPDKTKLELGGLVNLESLMNFSTKYSSVRDLLHMTKLRELKVFISDGCTSETLSSSLRQLRYLEALRLYDRQETRVAYHRGEIVLDCIHLKELELAMHMPRFPDQYQSHPHLSHIYLWCCSLEEDPMPILEKLLHLKSVILAFGAFVGRRMVCSKGGFSQLCALELIGQEELEEWIVEEGSMPCIRTLTIDKCRKLKELSDGIRYITSLKELKIVGMKEWMEKLVPCGEDYYKVQNVLNVRFINCNV